MPNGAVHALSYSSEDLETGYTPPGGPSYARTYDFDKALTSLTLPGGRKIDYARDPGGRSTGTTFPGGGVDVTYAGATDRPAEIRSPGRRLGRSDARVRLRRLASDGDGLDGGRRRRVHVRLHGRPTAQPALALLGT